MYRPERIYIVDDDADTRMLVASTLSVLGLEMEQFASGEAVLESLKSVLPDLLVLDVMMPGISGLEVLARFRMIEGSERVPVLMLTARDSVKDIVKGLDSGAEDYLTKPFNYEELQARARALLRVRALSESLHFKNEELLRMREQMITQEREALLGQLAGAAAHE
ncbi:MAG: response regulator transcription factor, partial [Bdellovibrionales bacterium]|nr:response regulator transcription factor [Bdellovibrionales bacterium]